MKVVRFVRFTCVIIYTEESVDVPQTCTFIEVTSNFLSPVRGYAGRERATAKICSTIYKTP